MSDLIVLVVAIGVAQPVESHAVAAGAGNVKAVERDEQPCAGDGRLQALDLRLPFAAKRRGRHSTEALVTFITDDQPAFTVAREADPRAEFIARYGQEPLDPEARQDFENSAPALEGRGPTESVAPGSLTKPGNDTRGDPPSTRAARRPSTRRRK